MSEKINIADRFSLDAEERFKYWKRIFDIDTKAKSYRKWVDNMSLCRSFLENELEEVMVKLKAGAVADPKEYWFRSSELLRPKNYFVGKVLSALFKIKVRALADTASGAVETEESKMVADLINDKLRVLGISDEIGNSARDFFMLGMGPLCVRADDFIDIELMQPSILIEYVNPEELILDSTATRNSLIRHIFRLRRVDISEIEYDYPEFKFISDKISDYTIENNIISKRGKTEDDNKVDFLEVEYSIRRKVHLKTILPELAQLVKSEEMLTPEEFQSLKEQIFAGIESPGKRKYIESLFDNTSADFMHTVKEYYYDAFCNGKSVLKEPQLKPFDPTITKNGFSYVVNVLEEVYGSPNGNGLIFYQKDKIAIVIMLLTLFMRDASRVNRGRHYVNQDALVDKSADNINKLIEGKGGTYMVHGDSRVEWSPQLDDLEMNLLNASNEIINRINNESGITPEMTGGAPFAGASASIYEMMTSAGVVQIVYYLQKYLTALREAINKYYVLLAEYSTNNLPKGLKLEIDFDYRSPNEINADALKIREAFNLGLVSGKRLLNALQIEDPDTEMNLAKFEQIGKAVASDPDLMNNVQQYLAMKTEEANAENQP